ncbi:MAG: IS4 family transposase [Candidatus Omnitrophica bacterium]|nr:IS4 family transposase [Candidatus Omnitrophota bacterium]
MNNRDIEWRRKKLEGVREQIESGQLNALRELLPNEIIQQICEDSAHYFRTRLLTPLATIFHMISTGISRDGSFQSAWQFNGQSGKSGSLAKARRRLPLVVWQRLDQWMIQEIDRENSSEYHWRGHRMVGVDGTCVSMNDEKELMKHFGRCNTRHGYSRFPLARVTLAFNLQTLVTLSHEAGNYTAGETELLRFILPRLQRTDVLVGDRHFAGANLYWEYQQVGIEFITRTHHQLQVERLKVVEIFNPKDKIVQLSFSPQHRRENPALPEFILVRLIQTTAKIKGREETFWIATSLLNPHQYPAQEIQGWLKKRWKVETLIEELKIWFSADVLRSKTIAGIYKELYARVIGLNLIHWLMLKSAKKHSKNPERISLAATLRLASAYSLKMSTAPGWNLPLLYETLLDHIALSTVPYRPDRTEPRMVKRDIKHYPKLKISRTEWRNIAMAA